MFKGSLIERVTSKFRALIGSYRRRIATKQRNGVQNVCHLNACNPQGSGDRQALLCEIIHTGKAFNPAAVAECILDKIHRLSQVRRIRPDPKKNKVGPRKSWSTDANSLPTALSSR